jgi:four helix bundle protein
MDKDRYVTKEKSFAWVIRIVRLSQYLRAEYKEFDMSRQILKSRTSIGANIREAYNAESKLDFIHKLGIAQKEADETCYWLELLQATNYLEKDAFNSIYQDTEEVLKIIKSIIITTKNNLYKSKK